MRGNHYTFLNNFNGKTFSIGVNTDGSVVSQVGNGLLLQEYPTFELDVRNEEKNKAGQHGIWDFYSFYGKRTVTFSGIILASSYSNLLFFENKIKEVLNLPAQPISGNDGYINVSWTDVDGLSWNIDCKITDDIRFSRASGNQLRAQFFISLKANDPYIKSIVGGLSEQTMGWRQGQFIDGAFLPNNINIKYNNVLQAYQNGSAESPGVYTVYGPCIAPKLTKLNEIYGSETLISTMEETGWVGGTIDQVHTQVETVGRALVSTNEAGAVMSLSDSWDLTLGEYITCYFWVDDKDNLAVGNFLYNNSIKLQTTVDADYFVIELDKVLDSPVSIKIVEGNSLTERGTTWLGGLGGAYGLLEIDTYNQKYGDGCFTFGTDFAYRNPSYPEIGAEDIVYTNNLYPALSLNKQYNNSVFRFWLYIPDISKYSSPSVEFWWGQVAGVNCWYKSVTTDAYGAPLHSGWNMLQVVWASATVYGTPDANAITEFRFDWNYGNDSSNTLTQACDSLTADGTWVAGDDATNIGVDTVTKKTGTGCIKFDVDVSASVADTATIHCTGMSPKDLSAYELTGKIALWVYIPSVTNLTSVGLYWGSPTDYWSKVVTTIYTGAAFVVGWNRLYFDWDTASITGAPDATAVVALSLRVFYTAGYTDQVNFRVDDIRCFAENDTGLRINNLEVFTYEKRRGVEAIHDGWNYFYLLKDEFKSVGTPSWGDINNVKFSIQAKNRTRKMLTFDNGGDFGVTYSGSGTFNTSLKYEGYSSYGTTNMAGPIYPCIATWATAVDFTDFDDGRGASVDSDYIQLRYLVTGTAPSSLGIVLSTAVGVDYFEYIFTPIVSSSWQTFKIAKSTFSTIGGADWSSIVNFSVLLSGGDGTTDCYVDELQLVQNTTLNVTFAELKSRDIIFNEQKLELEGYTLGATDSVVFNAQEGTILNQAGVDVSGYLSADSEWFYISPKQNLLLVESTLNPVSDWEVPYEKNNPIVEENLIAYWPLNELSSATTVLDYSGYSHDLTVGGGINFVSGIYGNCALGRASTGIMTCSSYFPESDFEYTDQFCFHFYINFSVGAGLLYDRIITTVIGPKTYYTGVAIQLLTGGKILVGLYSMLNLSDIPPNGFQATTATGFSDNKWHQVIISYNGSGRAEGVRIEIDHKDAAMMAPTINSLSGSIKTAGAPVNVMNHVSAYVEEFKVYNKLLTRQEKDNLFEQFKVTKYKNQVDISWYDVKL